MISITIRQFFISRTVWPTLIFAGLVGGGTDWILTLWLLRLPQKLNYYPVLSYIFAIPLYLWTPGHQLAHYEVFSNFHTINPAKDERFSFEHYWPISVTSWLAYLGELLQQWLFNSQTFGKISIISRNITLLAFCDNTICTDNSFHYHLFELLWTIHGQIQTPDNALDGKYF